MRAAAEGSATAATGAGKTYDPVCLVEFGVRGLQPDPRVAADWYRKAIALGDTEAAALLQRLNRSEDVQQTGPVAQTQTTGDEPH
jgi:TPR repeat protein